MRLLPPPPVSAPCYVYLKLQSSEKSKYRRWSHRESNWGLPVQKAAHLPTVLHAYIFITIIISTNYVPPVLFSSLVDPDVLQLAVQEGVEFEGDVELGKIASETKPEEQRPAWAQKVMACVESKGTGLFLIHLTYFDVFKGLKFKQRRVCQAYSLKMNQFENALKSARMNCHKPINQSKCSFYNNDGVMNCPCTHELSHCHCHVLFFHRFAFFHFFFQYMINT